LRSKKQFYITPLIPTDALADSTDKNKWLEKHLRTLERRQKKKPDLASDVPPTEEP
jgi:hypothetical protein